MYVMYLYTDFGTWIFFSFFEFSVNNQTNLGDIVQDDGMHMVVDIVVDNDNNNLFVAAWFFYGKVNVAIAIDNGIVTDIVVMVPSYNGHSGVVWSNMHAMHILYTYVYDLYVRVKYMWSPPHNEKRHKIINTYIYIQIHI